MNEQLNHLLDLKQFAETGRAKWIDGTNEMWIQQYPFSSWSHPLYTDTNIDETAASKLKDSFDRKIYGQRYVSDYEHGFDKAKGSKASGEIKELKVVKVPDESFSQTGLWARVSFSDTAKKEIDDGEWNYWSSSHYDSWTNPTTNYEHDMVYKGGALCNDPYVKGMVPLNFSELGITEEEAKNHAAAQLQLQEVALNHLDVDLTLARADALRAGINFTPQMTEDEIRNAIALHEHEGGEMDGNELETKLREQLKIGADVDILDHVKGMDDELAPLREALKESEAHKAFSEAYPEQAEELKRLRIKADEDDAKNFSSSFADVRFQRNVVNGDETKAENTNLGLTALSLEKVREFAKSFSNRTADSAGFKEVLDTILGPGGTVEYNTRGSSREDENDNDDNEEKNFSEKAIIESGDYRKIRTALYKVAKEIQEKDEVKSFSTAFATACKTKPELAAAYRNAKPILKAS